MTNVHIINLDRFREPREEPQYEGPDADGLYCRLQRLARRLSKELQADWEDYEWRHKLTDPDWSVDFIFEWLCECSHYTPISEAKRLEEDFEEGEQL